MGVIEGTLEPLDEEVRARVLKWAAERFGVPLGGGARRASGSGASGGGARHDTGGGDFEELADLYAAASPKSAVERALVGGYWFQYIKSDSDLDGAKVNGELKQLGHGVANITRAFDGLKAKKPALVMQTRKSGSSKQARKKYKLTNAGKQEVERMLASGGE